MAYIMNSPELQALIKQANQDDPGAGPSIALRIVAESKGPARAAQPAGSVLGKRPVTAQAAPKPTTVLVPPPVDQEAKSKKTSNFLLRIMKPIPVLGSALENAMDAGSDVLRYFKGDDIDDIEADRKARREAKIAAKLDTEGVALVEDDDQADEASKKAKAQEACKILSEMLGLEKDEDNGPALDETSRPAKKAKKANASVRYVGPVNYNQYMRIAGIMDAQDKNASLEFIDHLTTMYPNTPKYETKFTNALKLHKNHWGFPAYLMCLELAFNTSPTMKESYNLWLTNHLKVDPGDWNGQYEPPGLTEEDA